MVFRRRSFSVRGARLIGFVVLVLGSLPPLSFANHASWNSPAGGSWLTIGRSNWVDGNCAGAPCASQNAFFD